MGWHVLRNPLVDDVTIAHQYQLVEVDVGVGAGLVDRRQHSLTFVCQVDEEFDDRKGFETVKATGWFVEQKYLRVCD